MLCITINNIISIIGILIQSGIAIWVVRILQKRIEKQRYLKNHLIQEVKLVKDEYKTFLQSLQTGQIRPKYVVPFFKLINTKIEDLNEIMHIKYDFDKYELKEYHIEIRYLITNLEEFNNNYRNNEKIELSNESLNQLIFFQQRNYNKFNKTIIKINDNKD
mgnify:CR=1 FL=1